MDVKIAVECVLMVIGIAAYVFGPPVLLAAIAGALGADDWRTWAVVMWVMWVLGNLAGGFVEAWLEDRA